MKSDLINNRNYLNRVLRWFTKGRIAWVGIMLLAGSTGILFAARAYNKPAEYAPPATESKSLTVAPVKPASTSRPQGTKGYGVRVQFALYDVGIYPRVTRVKAGLVSIAIEDYSGGTSGMVVERVAQGNSPVQVGIARREGEHFRGTTIMELAAGTYEVYTAEHPNNRAKLVVDP